MYSILGVEMLCFVRYFCSVVEANWVLARNVWVCGIKSACSLRICSIYINLGSILDMKNFNGPEHHIDMNKKLTFGIQKFLILLFASKRGDLMGYSPCK
jgi:hypothetical protein